ncbi:MAG TPA: hypothetical protein VFH29_04555, partial [Anaerolineales bacterium]|nr:hypothetical protein [Anaerolineales bacterium]
SPAAMLGASRANVDLLVFSLMVLALALVSRYSVAALVVLMTGVLFKIFPILGVGFFLHKERNAGLRFMACAAALSLVYFAVTFRDMLLIFSITERGYEEAYGAAVLPALLKRLAIAPDLLERSVLYVQILRSVDAFLLQFPIAPYLLAGLVLVVFACVGLRQRTTLITADVRNLRAFWMGAGVYAGTFLLGNNFEYRLIFLLLCIPQLAEWSSRRQGVTTAAARLTLVLILAALWATIVQQPGIGTVLLPENTIGLLDQAANWMLLAAIAFMFGSSLPAWAVDDTTVWARRLVRRPHAAAPAVGDENGMGKRA